MTVAQTRIYTQARMMATDADLCRIFALTPAALERHRALIDQARAEAMTALRYERAVTTARRGKGKGGE